MEKRTKVLGLQVLTIAALSLMPVGSPGDKVALIVLALLLFERKILHALRNAIQKSSLLAHAVYSTTAIAVVWANTRYRLGGGPFHLAIGDYWRGYPFPFQEWVQVSSGPLWRDFCWNGALGDVFFVLVGCVAVTYFSHARIAQVPRILLLSAYSGVYAWLNVEVWLFAAPMLFIDGPNYIHDELPYFQTATLGFPFVYWHFDGGRHMWALVANIAIGIAGWLLLYAVLQWTRSDVTN